MSKPIAMTPERFIQIWQASKLTERSASHQHFLDLCELLDEPKPAAVDPEGTWFTFDRGATKTDGSDGFADVWKKDCFAWEYKGKHKNMAAALDQVKRYALALQNPPLLVTSDFDTIVITTNFNSTVTEVITIPITSMADPGVLQTLRNLFREPERLKPGETREQVTAKAAKLVGDLADHLRKRAPDGLTADQLAHFLNKLVFCLFAQNVELLPNHVITRSAEKLFRDFKPNPFSQILHDLFAIMAKGGYYGAEEIAWFNGGLFDEAPLVRVDIDELGLIRKIARLDWSQIDPAIFGTLFERGLDPAKRSQLGAHYTNPESIQRIIQPVVVEPLERDWAATLAEIDELVAGLDALTPKQQTAKRNAATQLFEGYLKRLAATRVLDPACGSGNFLYLSLRALHELQRRAIVEANLRGLTSGLNPHLQGVGPRNVLGIELNPYAAELARLTVWIGEIQWLRDRGLKIEENPVLQSLETIQCHDALLNDDGTEFDWPAATCIVGNPPFIGDKKMRKELGDAYVETVRTTYAGRVPGGADFVCYWFDKARAQIVAGKTERAGLVSTNSIRGGKNREVLDRVLADGLAIFDARANEGWFDTGVAVRVSMVSFAMPKAAGPTQLDGAAVKSIQADLSSGLGTNATEVQQLAENSEIAFRGVTKGGPFDVEGSQARKWLRMANPNGKPSSDVLRILVNGIQIARRLADVWVVDFGVNMAHEDATLYEAPYEYVKEHVKPMRAEVRRDLYRERWWLHYEARPGMRSALASLKRFIVTPAVSKHRIFAWLDTRMLADQQLFAIARDDDTTFGILHSRAHELWTLRLCAWLGVGDDARYSPTTVFETFPFPAGLEPNRPAADYAADPRAQAIAAAAQALVKLRDEWLNPTPWVDRVPEVVPGYPERIVAKPGHEAELKERTLTKLYNAKPQWLVNAHRALDEAVMAAYGWPVGLGDEEILGRLLALNQERAGSVVARTDEEGGEP